MYICAEKRDVRAQLYKKQKTVEKDVSLYVQKKKTENSYFLNRDQ